MLFAIFECLHGWLMPFPFWLNDLGRRGEYLARRHYHRRGYHLVAANWRHGRGEIDLVMANWRSLVFVEVKARRVRRDRPLGVIVKDKQRRRLLRLARTFVARWPDEALNWRFQLALLRFHSKRSFTAEISELTL